MLCGLSIQFAVEGKHAAEGGDGIGFESFSISFGEGGLFRAAAGVGVFDDGGGGQIELLDQLPGGVKVDQVVKGQFLALNLLGIGDAAMMEAIERGGLVRIFTIAKGLAAPSGDGKGRG